MDNSSFIQQLRDHISSGRRNAYTEPFLDLARKAIAEKTAHPEQQAELAALITQLETLPRVEVPSFLGASATSL